MTAEDYDTPCKESLRYKLGFRHGLQAALKVLEGPTRIELIFGAALPFFEDRVRRVQALLRRYL